MYTPSRYSFDAIGTQWEVDTDLPLPAVVRQRIKARVEAFDQTYSRFRADSLVSRVATAQAGGCFTFPADSPALFDLYDQLHGLTDGAVYPLAAGWNSSATTYATRSNRCRAGRPRGLMMSAGRGRYYAMVPSSTRRARCSLTWARRVRGNWWTASPAWCGRRMYGRRR